jgi:hypothetical protein
LIACEIVEEDKTVAGLVIDAFAVGIRGGLVSQGHRNYLAVLEEGGKQQ